MYFYIFLSKIIKNICRKHTADDLILLVSVSKRLFLKNNLLEFIVYFQFFLADFLDFTECKEVNLDGLNKKINKKCRYQENS